MPASSFLLQRTSYEEIPTREYVILCTIISSSLSPVVTHSFNFLRAWSNFLHEAWILLLSREERGMKRQDKNYFSHLFPKPSSGQYLFILLCDKLLRTVNVKLWFSCSVHLELYTDVRTLPKEFNEGIMQYDLRTISIQTHWHGFSWIFIIPFQLFLLTSLTQNPQEKENQAALYKTFPVNSVL